MSSQTPTPDTTRTTESTKATENTETTAGEIVSRFLSVLRRHDLEALALLLRAEGPLDTPGQVAMGSSAGAPDGAAHNGPAQNDSAQNGAGWNEEARDDPAQNDAAQNDAARERAARDCAQVVLRSFSGSGLVEIERHISTDGQTVFVEFGRNRPGIAGFAERRAGVRLLRFTTRAGAITGITEYGHPFAGAPGDQGRLVSGRGRRVGDGLTWPSLAAVRTVDRCVAER